MCGYAGTAFTHFFHCRLTFACHLASQAQSHSALTTSRYLRLIGMALTQMFWATALTCQPRAPPVGLLSLRAQRLLAHWHLPAPVHPAGALELDVLLLNGAHRHIFFFAFFVFEQGIVEEHRPCGTAVRRVVRIPEEKKKTPALAGSVARFAKPSATDVDFKDIPLLPSSFVTHTDADTATETDVPAYSSPGYSFDTLSTHQRKLHCHWVSVPRRCLVTYIIQVVFMRVCPRMISPTMRNSAGSEQGAGRSGDRMMVAVSRRQITESGHFRGYLEVEQKRRQCGVAGMGHGLLGALYSERIETIPRRRAER
ncbi:hypothetical protein K438DRAFT_1775344 [Mycena galopus ATCC 62051]|nr:hypothetical protein K438DRAFT_1775344 [Mycena galopus ATCC 62051]